MVAKVAELLDGSYIVPQSVVDDKGKEQFFCPSESIIYSDTDSSYFLTHATNLDDALMTAQAIEKTVNESFPDYVKFAFNSDNNVIACGLDLIANNSIFIKKKMYIMHLGWFDGFFTDKMKVMGLQIKKTTIPKPIGKQLTTFVERLLRNGEWRSIQEDIVQYRDTIRNTENILDMGIPGGIKNLDVYTQHYLNKTPGITIPGHIMAAIFYNACLEAYDDSESIKIASGSKIKSYLLKKPMGDFKRIALPTDLKHPPEWFIENFIDLIDRDEQALRLIDKPLSPILEAIGEMIPTKKSLLFDDLVVW